MLNTLLAPTLGFIQANYIKIIIIAVLSTLFYLTYYLTSGSVKKLKTEILPFYPFDIFLPQGGGWSIGYFLIVIVVLSLLIYFMVKGNFYLQPA